LSALLGTWASWYQVLWDANGVGDSDYSIGSKSIDSRERVSGWRNDDIKIEALSIEELVIAHKFR
jgi:hypothetical protein